jgi:small subunit ribosomal protein S13
VSREFNYIVRLHGSNLDGTKLLPYALCELKGVGIRVARTMIKSLGLDATQRLGSLNEANIKRLEDVDVMRETRSWKGERHARGLKVRGQRTKTTARKGRSVGVSRARVRQQQQ